MLPVTMQRDFDLSVGLATGAFERSGRRLLAAGSTQQEKNYR